MGYILKPGIAFQHGGGSPKVEKASKMRLLSLLPLLCVVSAAPEGGLFGFGLLGGDSTTNTTTTPAPSTTPAELSRTWSTFSPGRWPPSPSTSCPTSWASTTRFRLPSVTPLASSPTP